MQRRYSSEIVNTKRVDKREVLLTRASARSLTLEQDTHLKQKEKVGDYNQIII